MVARYLYVHYPHEQTAEREYTLLDLLFLAKSIRNCYRVVSGDRNNLRSIHSKANAFVWQRENMSTIDKATRLLTVSEVVLGDHSALVNHQKTGWLAYVLQTIMNIIKMQM